MKHRGGFTLAEILVGASLSLLITFVVLELVLPPILLFQKQAVRAEVEQSAMLAFGQIRSALLETSGETVSTTTDLQTLCLQPLIHDVQPYGVTGTPLLQDHFLLFSYDSAQRQLVRKSRAPGGFDFSKPCQMDALALAAAATTTDKSDRVILRDVETAQFGETGSVVFPLRIVLTVKVKEPRKEHTWTLDARVNPRNGR